MKKVIPVVVGTLGAISTGFKKYVAGIRIEMKVKHARKTCETFDNRLLPAFTKLAGATNNKCSERIINKGNKNNDNNNTNDRYDKIDKSTKQLMITTQTTKIIYKK